MKSISVTFAAQGLIIPFNYHHEVQSLIYALLRDGDSEQSELHDVGMGSRNYKLFTFSSLRGRKIIKNGKMHFEDLVYLDIRSVKDDFCDAILTALDAKPTLSLFGQNIKVIRVNTSAIKLSESRVNIQMLSPVEVHITDDENHSRYFSPLESEFVHLINENFRRKYKAFTGLDAESDINISVVSVGTKDKYVTTYKGLHITAWRGKYVLSGNPEYLNFLYYCGLGSRNSNGFGMFGVISD